MTEDNAFTAEKGTLVNRCYWVVVFACCGIILLEICAQFFRHGIRDDSYMFVRYADNILAYGNASWNPGGEATYGLTSSLFLVVVLPILPVMPTT